MAFFISARPFNGNINAFRFTTLLIQDFFRMIASHPQSSSYCDTSAVPTTPIRQKAPQSERLKFKIDSNARMIE